ncbi:histidine phosphatase family protein [uncultured Serinicoccus sp.]|uniref:SixA phosphatase family protein n=1 Tax=uncultured Serinicoccus sp. TaxID=735514 RepID=UPI002608EC71|nr:histidine phosphatase family protein [uncultured Serinicoccus sp.]
MPTLVLVRHAKAEVAPPGPGGDHARELSSRGRRDAAALGGLLTDGGWAPDLALVSTAARAVQTLEHALAGREVETWPTRRIYDGGIDGVLEAVREVPDGVGVLWVVGHEPVLSSTAWELTDSGEHDQGREALQGGLPTGAAAVLDLAVPWSDMGPGVATVGTVLRGR